VRVPAALNSRSLSAAALLTYVLDAIASQRFVVNADSNIAAVLLWRHYEAALHPTLLWCSMAIVSMSTLIGLIGIFRSTPWGRWTLLGSYAASLVLSLFSGLAIMTPLPHFLGTVSYSCGIASLTLSFLGQRQSSTK